MENAVEALKIAFAVMMFVVALSLSISSLSTADSAVDAIIHFNDRETEYSYVEPTDSNRTVGVESIIPTMYRAYEENFDVYFYKKDGTELILYYAIDNNGNRKKDEIGNDIGINYINGSEVFADAQEKVEHLNRILGNPNDVIDNYKRQLNTDYTDGLYEFFSGKKFKEQLGEYYVNENENTPEANKVKKRVITYTSID